MTTRRIGPRLGVDASGYEADVPRYRIHYTHPDGMTTTGDFERAHEPTVGELLDLDGGRWEVQEVEPFQLEDYTALVAVVPASDED